MSLSRLPKGDNSFRMSGSSGFTRSLSNLVRHGEFSNLADNQDLIIQIFTNLAPTIRKRGKISYSTRIRTARRFAKASKTSKKDIADFRKILNYYK